MYTREKMKQCDKLWAEIVKMKASYYSEYSNKAGRQIGGEDVLHAHHLMGKATRAMRYCIDNGICLTAGEHHFIAHVEGRKTMFHRRVLDVRGNYKKIIKIESAFLKGMDMDQVLEYLNDYKNKIGGTNDQSF
jgi:hypothetical protein